MYVPWELIKKPSGMYIGNLFCSGMYIGILFCRLFMTGGLRLGHYKNLGPTAGDVSLFSYYPCIAM